MKSALVMLFDMCGLERCEWIRHNVELLDPYYSSQRYVLPLAQRCRAERTMATFVSRFPNVSL